MFLCGQKESKRVKKVGVGCYFATFDKMDSEVVEGLNCWKSWKLVGAMFLEMVENTMCCRNIMILKLFVLICE